MNEMSAVNYGKSMAENEVSSKRDGMRERKRRERRMHCIHNTNIFMLRILYSYRCSTLSSIETVKIEKEGEQMPRRWYATSFWPL